MDSAKLISTQSLRQVPFLSISSRWKARTLSNDTHIWDFAVTYAKKLEILQLREIQADRLVKQFVKYRYFSTWARKCQRRTVLRCLLLKISVRRLWRNWQWKWSLYKAVKSIYRKLKLYGAMDTWIFFVNREEKLNCLASIYRTLVYHQALSRWKLFCNFGRAEEWHSRQLVRHSLDHWARYKDFSKAINNCNAYAIRFLLQRAIVRWSTCLKATSVHAVKGYFNEWRIRTCRTKCIQRLVLLLQREQLQLAWAAWMQQPGASQNNDPAAQLLSRANRARARTPCRYVKRYYKASIGSPAKNRSRRKKSNDRTVPVVVRKHPVKTKHDPIDETLGSRLNDAFYLLRELKKDPVWGNDDVLSKSFHRNKNQIKLSYWY